MENLSKQKPIYKIAVCAMMIALNTVLSMIKIWQLPFGGSVTLLSMLPVVLVSVMYGIGWGLGAGFVSSLIQLALDLGKIMSWGLTAQILIGSIFLDYLVPFTVIGLAGIFRRKGYAGIIGGTALAVALRFLSHFLSGFILWANLEKFVIFGKEWVSHPVLYSLCYNGQFMLPELILTTVGVALLFRSRAVKRLAGIA